MVPGGEIKAAPVVAVKPSTGTSGGGITSTPVNGTGQFLFPTTGYISQYSSKWHTAIDVANRAYPDVYAADSGTVVYSGWDSTGYGLTVLLDHGNGYVTRYAHASALYVKTGESVTRGQAIMKMGSTGRSTGPHLHFEIKYKGVKQNPMLYL